MPILAPLIRRDDFAVVVSVAAAGDLLHARRQCGAVLHIPRMRVQIARGPMPRIACTHGLRGLPWFCLRAASLMPARSPVVLSLRSLAAYECVVSLGRYGVVWHLRRRDDRPALELATVCVSWTLLARLASRKRGE